MALKAQQVTNAATPKVNAQTLGTLLGLVAYQLLITKFPVLDLPEFSLYLQALFALIIGRVVAWCVRDNASIPVYKDGTPAVSDDIVELIRNG